MKMMVTGGAGFIGSHLVDRLLRDGYDVVVIDNLYRGRLDNLTDCMNKDRFHFINLDIAENTARLTELMTGCDTVFHLAAQSNVMGAVHDIDYSFNANVVGTFNVLKAAQGAGVRRLIFSSSREAYGEAQYLPVDEKHPLASKNSYGASKVAGEKYCEVFRNMYGLEVVILRLGNVYGERDFDRVIPIFLANVFRHEDIHIYGGQQVIDFIAVPLVIETMIRAVDSSQALDMPTNVASGKGTTLFELAKRIKKVSASENRVVVDPPRSVEVVKFTADTKRFNTIFGIDLPEDPLYYLDNMINKPKVDL